MVIRPEEPLTFAVATEQLRTRKGKKGRDLARALRRLGENKLTKKSAKVGIFAAILELQDRELISVLLPAWAAACGASLEDKQKIVVC